MKLIKTLFWVFCMYNFIIFAPEGVEVERGDISTDIKQRGDIWRDRARDIAARAWEKAREFHLRLKQLGEKGLMHAEYLGTRVKEKLPFRKKVGIELIKADHEKESSAMDRRHRREQQRLQDKIKAEQHKLQIERAKKSMQDAFEGAIDAVEMREFHQDDNEEIGESENLQEQKSIEQESHPNDAKPDDWKSKIEDLKIDEKDKEILKDYLNQIKITKEDINGNRASNKFEGIIRKFHGDSALREILRDKEVQSFFEKEGNKVPAEVARKVKTDVLKIESSKWASILVLGIVGLFVYSNFVS